MFVRLYTGDDGQSHFEDQNAPKDPFTVAPVRESAGYSFHRSEPGYFMDWHNAPRRQYVISLSGHMEIGIGDGTVRRFGPGDVVLAEDLTGRGHTTRVVGDQPRVSLTVRLS